MKDALRNYEEAHPERCVLIASEDQFYGFSKSSNRLARHVQWVYVPAVKDATKENIESKNTALGKILARTVRAKVNFGDEIQKLKDDTLGRYRDLISAQQGALDDISKSLTTRLKEWAHPAAKARVEWVEDARKSVQVEEPLARLFAGEGLFEGELARFGHGLQRSYLLALLQELASADDPSAPRLILGCEEPELYQHPPQARHLAAVLQQLAERNAQIIVSTHSPYFVSGASFESVRMVRCDPVARLSRVVSTRFDAIATRIQQVTGERLTPLPAQAARLQQALQFQLNEMFFAPKIVFVEGLEDVGYITSWMMLSNRWEDFRRHGCHIVPANGKDKLIEPLVIAEAISIPAYVVFDSDGSCGPNQRPRHERDNKALLAIAGGDPATPFPAQSVWGTQFAQWPENLGETVRAEIGKSVWDKAYGAATRGLGNPDGSFAKNITHIGDHLTLLHADNVAIPTLDKLCDEIIRFASA